MPAKKDTPATGIRIDPELKRRFLSKINAVGLKMSPLIEGWIAEYVEEKKEQLPTLKLPDDLAEELRIALVRRGALLQDAMAQAVRLWLDEPNRTGPTDVSTRVIPPTVIEHLSTESEDYVKLAGEILRSENIPARILRKLLLVLAEEGGLSVAEPAAVSRESESPSAINQRKRMERVREIAARHLRDKKTSRGDGGRVPGEGDKHPRKTGSGGKS